MPVNTKCRKISHLISSTSSWQIFGLKLSKSVLYLPILSAFCQTPLAKKSSSYYSREQMLIKLTLGGLMSRFIDQIIDLSFCRTFWPRRFLSHVVVQKLRLESNFPTHWRKPKKCQSAELMPLCFINKIVPNFTSTLN
jgi:hypothetical protein